MGKLTIVTATALALLLPAAAFSQGPRSASPISTPAAGPAADAAGQPARPGQIPPSGPPIVLQVSKGTLIRLPAPANTVFVANSDIADVTIKTPSLVYVTAKAPGETVLYAVDAGDHVLLNSIVRVDHDLSRVRESMQAIAPGENVSVSSVDNSLVLSGKVSSAARAEKLRSMAASIAGETKGNVVNRMSVITPNQVNIRVKIAEVDRQALKSIGVNWQKLTGNIQFVTNNPIGSTNITTFNQLATFVGGHNAKTLAVLDALAQENLLTTLAEPNLTATNGQPASFLAGGEFPVPIASTAATAGALPTVTIEFKTFGVSLDVTPTILDADHLSLRVRPEVSQLSSNGAVTLNNFVIPALTVARADTTVQLSSGQSFLLGGLIQNNTTQNVSKVPWLGDVPVLGQLFRSEQFQHNQTELVIIVTPYLVQPAVASLATPVDGFRPPHDGQRIIDGDTYRQTLPAPANGPIGTGGQGVIGPVGFRLD